MMELPGLSIDGYIDALRDALVAQGRRGDWTPGLAELKLDDHELTGNKKTARLLMEPNGLTVGVAGFEPTTSSSRTKRATKLRHTPMARRPQ